MKSRKIGITTATIKGLNNDPHYSKVQHCYIWDITFSESVATFIHDVSTIYAEATKQDAINACNEAKKSFNNISIVDDDRVALIFDEADGKIIAIGYPGENIWIDIEDNFSVKTFKKLDVTIESLFVF